MKIKQKTDYYYLINLNYVQMKVSIYFFFDTFQSFIKRFASTVHNSLLVISAETNESLPQSNEKLFCAILSISQSLLKTKTLHELFCLTPIRSAGEKVELIRCMRKIGTIIILCLLNILHF